MFCSSFLFHLYVYVDPAYDNVTPFG